MITPMEKITALIYHKEKNDFLISLQKLEVIHVSIEKKEEADNNTKALELQIQQCNSFLAAAKKNIVLPPGKQTTANAFEYVQSFENIKTDLTDNSSELEKIERQISNLAPWGDFDIQIIKKLKNNGVDIRFFIVPIKKFTNCANNQKICLQEISRDKIYVYFVIFEKGEKIEIGCDEFFYPDLDKKELKKNLNTLRKKIKEKEKKLQVILTYRKAVEDYRNKKETELRFLSVSNNLPSAVEQTVYIVNGWIPRKLKAKVESFLEEKGIYHYFSQPTADENVPILLTNNWFSRLFEPITKLFSLPNYTELDLTAFFAPFFTLFFGFCLSDAGYGLIILFGCVIFWKKVAPEKQPFLVLGSIFGISTFLFGLITGNLFGVELVHINFFRKMVLLDSNQLFYLSLKIGVVQIFFGIFLKAVGKMRQFGFWVSVSSWGWMIMLTGVLPLVLAYLGKKPSLPWAQWTALTGLVLILFFNDLKANILVRIGKGLWELYGGLTGFLGDVLSYIRLFALGISSSILGLVFNNIAWQCKDIPIIGFFVTFVLLIVLHSINFALGVLSSFVHPLRLTFVEFYKNAGFSGGGKAYNPFREG
ncbi:MAG: V-type ATPase 116kDa subunit family protein [Candidatus Omnitrophota bacterium]